MVYGLNEGLQWVWEWKKVIGGIVLWYVGLVVVRDEFEMGELYLLMSGFWVIYLVGFTPREPGELSAYSHFNENHERILGSLDPVRAGRELTGQILYDDRNQNNTGYVPQSLRSGSRGNGQVLGRAGEDENDEDLQRALLLSLREERESRKRN
jgi:hypothetical protein